MSVARYLAANICTVSMQAVWGESTKTGQTVRWSNSCKRQEVKIHMYIQKNLTTSAKWRSSCEEDVQEAPWSSISINRNIQWQWMHFWSVVWISKPNKSATICMAGYYLWFGWPDPAWWPKADSGQHKHACVCRCFPAVCGIISVLNKVKGIKV